MLNIQVDDDGTITVKKDDSSPMCFSAVSTPFGKTRTFPINTGLTGVAAIMAVKLKEELDVIKSQRPVFMMPAKYRHNTLTGDVYRDNQDGQYLLVSDVKQAVFNMGCSVAMNCKD